MAQLKDLIVNGASRLIGDAYANNIQSNLIKTEYLNTEYLCVPNDISDNRVTISGDGIEIYHSLPHIDFHYQATSDDYSARLVCDGPDRLSCDGKFYGAVWNDYAEYRKNNQKEKDIQQPGRCVKENGDGTLSLTTKRLERGCEIISDTFGFAIGQDEDNGYNTPIASSGRVLAYPYESIEEFASHIGYAVCSGPNGTVSIMTDEEEEKYPSRIIGTISEIPDYEEWGSGKVKVNGRIWIRIR